MKKLATIAAGVAATVVAFAGPAGAQEGTADVVVVHGVPDTPVDVYVDGEVALDDFQFGTITDAISLPAGAHELAVRAADADASAAPLLSATATLAAGQRVSVVAHLGADGQPRLTPFVDDVSPTAAGQGRLVVRHTAAAPAVDVLAGGEPAFRDLTNPNEASADLPAGTVPAAVAVAGTTDPVIGPADVPVREGRSTIVYAVGSAQAGNLSVLVQSISGLHSSPTGVAAGNSGLAAEGAGSALPVGLVAAGALGAGLLAVGAVRRQTAA